MSDTSTILGLPYIMAAQAQKHVTHNEALRLLDAIVQLSVLDRSRTAPPASPSDGDRHLVATGATGEWAGWDLNVAFWVDGVWIRLAPRVGWLAWVAAESTYFVWTGSSWAAVGVPSDVPDNVFSLVNAADSTRRAVFSVAGIGAGQTRTFTLPNSSSELAILAGTQTFTGNKTFSGTLTVSAPVASIGTATTTATYGMGTGVTTTGVTKTVNIGTGGASGSSTVVNIGSATAGALGTMVVNTPTVTFGNAVTQVGMPQANLTSNFLGLGGAAADSFNRLSANSPAVLLNNAGAGIEVTVNKAAAAHDASFAFKTGFSTRALIGLLGNDDFAFKVSPDGAVYFDAIRIDRASGRPTFPAGATFDGPVSGTAITQSALDTTAGRLLKVGDFGLGGLSRVFPGENLDVTDNSVACGFYAAGFSISGRPVSASGTLQLLHLRRSAAGGEIQLVAEENFPQRLFARGRVTGGWSSWSIYNRTLGTVAQVDGAPTGSVLQRGSNANGEFLRLADGTMICWGWVLTVATGDVIWTYPSAFVNDAVRVSATPNWSNPVLYAARLTAKSAASVAVSVHINTNARFQTNVEMMAVGRWF